jgi:hypothetical protein
MKAKALRGFAGAKSRQVSTLLHRVRCSCTMCKLLVHSKSSPPLSTLLHVDDVTSPSKQLFQPSGHALTYAISETRRLEAAYPVTHIATCQFNNKKQSTHFLQQCYTTMFHIKSKATSVTGRGGPYVCFM